MLGVRRECKTQVDCKRASIQVIRRVALRLRGLIMRNGGILRAHILFRLGLVIARIQRRKLIQY